MHIASDNHATCNPLYQQLYTKRNDEYVPVLPALSIFTVTLDTPPVVHAGDRAVYNCYGSGSTRTIWFWNDLLLDEDASNYPVGVVSADTYLIIGTTSPEHTGTNIQCVVTLLVNSEPCNSSAEIILEVIGKCCKGDGGKGGGGGGGKGRGMEGEGGAEGRRGGG